MFSAGQYRSTEKGYVVTQGFYPQSYRSKARIFLLIFYLMIKMKVEQRVAGSDRIRSLYSAGKTYTLVYIITQ